MIKVKIGGVPEHFNLPWHLTCSEGVYKKHGIDLKWENFPGGMCKPHYKSISELFALTLFQKLYAIAN